MADPVLVPSTPTVQQGDTPEQVEAFGASLQEAFDRATKTGHEPKVVEPPKEPATSTTTPEATKTEQTPETKEVTSDVKTPEVKSDETKLPSFIEEALKVSPESSQPKVADEEFPEELPEFKTPEERTARYRKWREEYKRLKDENQKLASRPQTDETATAHLKFLEEENKKMRGVLERTSVETHPDFQNKIIRPMHAAWNEAARVVKELGGDPSELAKALSLSGKARFETLDAIMEGMPESAKVEINNAISNYHRIDEARRAALQQAPKTLEALRQEDMRKQYGVLEGQKKEMATMFEQAVNRLRDEARVEILQKSSDPDAKDWNEKADQIVQQSRDLFLNNTDMEKMAYACILAPLADSYRKLWISERQARTKSEQTLKEKFGSEPSMSESGGHGNNTTPTLAEDLKKPFKDVFLEKFHQLQSQGR